MVCKNVPMKVHGLGVFLIGLTSWSADEYIIAIIIYFSVAFYGAVRFLYVGKRKCLINAGSKSTIFSSSL